MNTAHNKPSSLEFPGLGPQLVKDLDNADPNIRAKAYKQLAEIDTLESTFALLKAYDSDEENEDMLYDILSDEIYQQYCYDDYCPTGCFEPSPSCDNCLPPKRNYVQPEYIPFLLEALEKNDSDEIREFAADVLGYHPTSPQIITALANALHNESCTHVRECCIGALGKHSTLESTKALVEAYSREKDHDIVRALKKHDNPLAKEIIGAWEKHIAEIRREFDNCTDNRCSLHKHRCTESTS